jgi:pimeloyl-ACP methyl ester carboxylesterase
MVATLSAVAALALLGSAAAGAGASVRSDPPITVTAGNHDNSPDRRIPAGFIEQKTQVGDVAINYVRGGHGKTLVLVHGYPQTWYEWRGLLPELAKHYTVIAPDLRGAGKSDAPARGYDKKTLAADLHGLLSKLGLDRDIRLVGHDIGTMVAYAYAAAHPDDVTKLVLSEAPIPDPSLYDFPSLTAQGPGVWNFGFFSLTNGLPEQIIDGREELWVDRFTDSLEVQKDGIGPVQVREFAKYLRDDAHLRASFEWFRAFPTDIADNANYARTKLTMPVLALGASHSLGERVAIQVRRYATNVTGGVIADSGHWIYEEHPAELTQRLLTFLR